MPTRETDPSAYWGSIVAAVGAALALLVSFGVPLSEPQTVAILGFGTALGPIVTQWLVRRDAWSPVAHFREIREVETHVLEDLDGEDGAVSPTELAAWLVVVILAVVAVHVILRLL